VASAQSAQKSCANSRSALEIRRKLPHEGPHVRWSQAWIPGSLTSALQGLRRLQKARDVDFAPQTRGSFEALASEGWPTRLTENLGPLMSYRAADRRAWITMTSSYTSPRWCQFQNLAAERHLANRAVFTDRRRDRRSYASGPSLVASPLPDPSAAASAT
jgi:hypothetical protein